MHVLLTNDDGPLDDSVCPYFKYLVDEIISNTDWKLSIVVPDQQRSWIGKAHFAGKPLTTKYIYTTVSTHEENDEINNFIGPFNHPQSKLKRDHQQWTLINSTPAACSDIGIHHLNEGIPVDFVISGPNFGKNSTNLYSLTSGTIGAAMEANTHGVKSIALSFAFQDLNHDYAILKKASQISLKLIKKLIPILKNSHIDLFSINVPLVKSLNNDTKIHYAPILQNQWKSIYTPSMNENGELMFSWTPDFKKVYKDGLNDFTHSDSRVLLQEQISVTPLKASFNFIEPLFGEIKLENEKYLLIDIPQSSYIYDSLVSPFEKLGYNITNDVEIIKSQETIFHYCDYENIDLDSIHQDNYYIPSYIYRKALIRKHYLSNTIHHYITKNQNSILRTATPETFQLELDYAEFLDDALDDSYELRDEINKNNRTWILKPSMSDKGQGIRIFNTIDQLQEIFNSFEINEDEDDEHQHENGVIVSQLRHFIIQEYKSDPLLLPQYDDKKFHLRVYVISQGNLNVFVYKQILTLFANSKYVKPTESISMDGHLTNTCLQNETPLVVPFWEISNINHDYIFNQICQIVKELFKAASTVDKINFQPLKNSCEIFGVDFLVNQDSSVSLLEVNSYPDFKQTGDNLKPIIETLFNDAVVHIIDPMINKVELKSCDNLIKVL